MATARSGPTSRTRVRYPLGDTPVTGKFAGVDGFPARLRPTSYSHAGTNDSGLFTFSNRENWDVLIKVLDGCSVNGHVWVYGASTTDFGYSTRVTDTLSGSVEEYRNEPGLSTL